MKTWFIGLFAIALIVLGVGLHIRERAKKHDAMPDGWSLMCDGEGRYVFRDSNGFISCTEKRSRQEAIDWAWYMHAYWSKPTQEQPKRNWRVCE